VTKADVVGVWTLEKFEVDSGAGPSAWGQALRGLLFYTENGHVSVGINRNVGLPHFNPANDSLFYAGTYDVHEDQIVHRICVATSAQRIDAEMIRIAKFVGTTLVLTGQSDSGKPFSLVWKRT